MAQPLFRLFRHRNRILVDQVMEDDRSRFDPAKGLSLQDQINPKYLKVMKLLARMREAADRSDMGFYGSFVTPEGFHYSITNIENDSHLQSQQGIDYFVKLQVDEDYDLNQVYKKMRIVSTDGGIQLQIIDEN